MVRGGTNFSLSLNLEAPPLGLVAQFVQPVCGYEPVDSETCSPAPGAVTHQGAVVQQGGGEVAAEAERQDVALPGAEGHLALWKRQKEGRWWVGHRPDWTAAGSSPT